MKKLAIVLLFLVSSVTIFVFYDTQQQLFDRKIMKLSLTIQDDDGKSVNIELGQPKKTVPFKIDKTTVMTKPLLKLPLNPSETELDILKKQIKTQNDIITMYEEKVSTSSNYIVGVIISTFFGQLITFVCIIPFKIRDYVKLRKVHNG